MGSRREASASVLDFSEHASDEAFALFRSGRCGRQFAAFFQRRENFFDFVVCGESSATRFRKNQAPFDKHIELTRLAGFDFGVFTESGIE